MNALAGKRVLVVEDEALLAMMVTEILERGGATIVGPAATLGKGLALATEGQIDLALLDVNIRGELIDPVTHMLYSRRIPFVFTTGYGKRPAGPWVNAPIIDKPFAEGALLRAIKQALQGD